MTRKTLPVLLPKDGFTKHGQEYSNFAYIDPVGIVTAAMKRLADIQFDTFVCRGLSGVLVAPLLARAMSKNFLIVRKPDEKSHSVSRVEGTFGEKWIFVDDFIGSGATFNACEQAVDALRTKTTFVGTYQYQTDPVEERFRREGAAACGLFKSERP